MSRKRRRAGKKEQIEIKPKPAVKIYQKWGFVILALVLAGIPFVLGKYIEFNSPGAFDSGAYVYSAKHILEGARIDIEEKTSAQPGTLLVNVIGVRLFGFSEFGPKLIQGILQAGALVLMFHLMRKLFGAVAAVVGVTAAAVYLSAPVIAKFGNVKEQYMIAFMLMGGCCFLFGQMDGRWWWNVLTGAALLNAFYFKPTGVSIIIAVIVFLVASVVLRRIKFDGLLRQMWLLLLGGFAGLIPLLVLYGLCGDLGRFEKTIPILGLRLALVLLLGLTVIWGAIHVFKKHEIFRQLKAVRRGIWKAGFVLLILSVLIVVVGGIVVKNKWEADRDDAISYVKDITFIKYPLRLYVKLDIIFERITNRVFSGYVLTSWKQVDWTEHRQKVFRYYGVLKVPIFLAFGALAIGLCRFILKLFGKIKELKLTDRVLLFLGVWWILDMAFVWISPRSYEQYYLPLNASGALTGGCLIWYYSQLKDRINRTAWLVIGGAGVTCMLIMSSHIFLGLKNSPDIGQPYKDSRGQIIRRRGFAQRLEEISSRRKNNDKYPWEQVGEYIKNNSEVSDKIYVWGWYPGIYVKAQRLSPATKAYESDMHVKSPKLLKREVKHLVSTFESDKPQFIVDSRKRHFPWNRPPLELWPRIPKGFMGAKETKFLPPNEKIIEQYDSAWAALLEKQIEADEAKRYEAMKPFREFVMKNYSIAGVFGEHVLFKLKANAPVGPVDGG